MGFARWSVAVIALSLAACDGESMVDAGMDGGDTPMDDAGRDAGMGNVDAGPMVDPPMTFTEVVSTGFSSPTDAVASNDGTTFIFAAWNSDEEPAIFTVPAGGGAAVERFAGAPLEYPSGLVLSCDGATLYIADPVADPDGDGNIGAIFALTVSGSSAPTPVAITNLGEPNALGINTACDELVIAGRRSNGEGAVMTAPIAGGAASVRTMGDPLVSPTGLYVDADDTAWVLDHLAEGIGGQGVLFSVEDDGTTTRVISGLALGTPGGISLDPTGGIGVIGTRERDGTTSLTVVSTSTTSVSVVPLPTAFIDPAGLRCARNAAVYVLVDSEGSAIYRGE